MQIPIPWETNIYDAKRIHTQRLIERKDDNKIPTIFELVAAQEEKVYKTKYFFDKTMPEAIKKGICISSSCMVFPIPIDCFIIKNTHIKSFNYMSNTDLIYHLCFIDRFNKCFEQHGIGFPVVSDFRVSSPDSDDIYVYKSIMDIFEEGINDGEIISVHTDALKDKQKTKGAEEMKQIIELEMIDKWGKDHNELYKKLYLCFWSF